MNICRKRKHRSPAAARKWLRHKYKQATDAKHIYPCPHHGDELVYHLTRMTQPEAARHKELARRAEIQRQVDEDIIW